MKKVCFIFNHFQFQNGVCRSVIAYANLLTRKNLAEVTLVSLFKYENELVSLLEKGV